MPSSSSVEDRAATTPAELDLKVLGPPLTSALFIGFVLLHVVTWTAIPALFDNTGPEDVIEGLAWGHEWQLGYYKHPPLWPWLLEVGARVSGDQLWACFLVSQLAIAVSFWAIWQLARSIVSPLGALIAVLLLEGTATFTRYSPEFNANIVELPFWALAGWSFHRALRLHRSGDWALLGVWLALAGYGKYVAALLAATMVGFLLLDPLARRSWRTTGPYLCAAICITLLLPHLGWVIQRGSPTLSYVLSEVEPARGQLDRLVFALKFAYPHLLRALPALLCIALLRPCRAASPAISLAGLATPFDRRIVAALAFGPFLIAVAVSVFAGMGFRAHWGNPLWCFVGLFAVLFLVPSTSATALRRFRLVWTVMFVATPLSCIATLTAAPYLTAAGWPGLDRFLSTKVATWLEFPRFPAHELAVAVTDGWHAKVPAPLRYVIGDSWIGGTIAFHSGDRPSLLIDGDLAKSPWVNIADLRQKGAVVAWNPDNDRTHLATALRLGLPGMAMQPPILLPLSTGAALPPARIMWAIIYPAGVR